MKNTTRIPHVFMLSDYSCIFRFHYIISGWVIFGTLMTFASFVIALFPRRLKKKTGTKFVKEPEPTKSVETIPKLSGIK